MSPLLAVLAFQATAIEPEKDPNLAKPITVHLATASLKDVTAALAKTSGQPIDVSGTVSDWKATVLVKELPVGRTMAALADTLGLVWKKDGSYYRLARPDGSAAAEKDYLESERKDRTKVAAAAPDGQADNITVTGVDGRVINGRTRGNRRLPGGGGGTRTYRRFDPNLLNFEGSNGRPPTRLDPPYVSGTSEYAKAILAWPSVPKKVDEAWSASVTNVSPGKSKWENGAFVMGDLLVAWHDSTGLPVVADAFRVPMKSNALRSGSALASLQALANTEQGTFKLSDGIARLRHPAFWRLRDQEVPESAWNNLERGQPNLDEYASFASRLNVAQVAAFRSMESPMSHVPTKAVREAYPALLLWSTLPTQARRTLLAGTPLGIASVRNATSNYVYALQEAPYYNAGDPTVELKMQPAQLGIFAKSAGNALEIRLASESGGGVVYLVTLP